MVIWFLVASLSVKDFDSCRNMQSFKSWGHFKCECWCRWELKRLNNFLDFYNFYEKIWKNNSLTCSQAAQSWVMIAIVEYLNFKRSIACWLARVKWLLTWILIANIKRVKVLENFIVALKEVSHNSVAPRFVLRISSAPTNN